jgi:hypothetical protein
MSKTSKQTQTPRSYVISPPPTVGSTVSGNSSAPNSLPKKGGAVPPALQGITKPTQDRDRKKKTSDIAVPSAAPNNPRDKSSKTKKDDPINITDGPKRLSSGKLRKPHQRIVGKSEILSKIYNQNQIRAVFKNAKPEEIKRFYINNPIAPAPTRNAIATCMRVYSARFLKSQSTHPALLNWTKSSSRKIESSEEAAEESSKKKKDVVSIDSQEVDSSSSSSTASTDSKTPQINVSHAATVRILHATNVAIGNIFELIINTHGEKNEEGIYVLKQKLTVSMLLRAFMTMVHFNHIHPKIKGDSNLLITACNTLVSIYSEKALIIKNNGKEYYDKLKDNTHTMFKNSLQADVSSPLYRGEGIDGTFARYRITDAQKGCLFILEMYSRLLISEVVYYSMELINQKGMVTITDLVCDRALSIIGFNSQ